MPLNFIDLFVGAIALSVGLILGGLIPITNVEVYNDAFETIFDFDNFFERIIKHDKYA